MSKQTVLVLFDGDCPFCSQYVQVLRLRENFEVLLENARERPDLVAKFKADGFDVSEGFIVEINDSAYHGSDALSLLSGLTSSSGILNRLMANIFKHRWLARICYPVMKLGRNLTLTVMGRKSQI